jgi:hypothetical protein
MITPIARRKETCCRAGKRQKIQHKHQLAIFPSLALGLALKLPNQLEIILSFPDA